MVQTPGVVDYVTLEHPFVVDQFNARQSPLQALEVLFGEQELMNLGRNSPPELQEVIDASRAIPLDDPARVVQLVSARRTWRRESMPSFRYTLRRW